MTVTVRPGDLFRSDAQTLVNTVNTVGVMGKGIALEFKKRFPEMYVDYVQRCQANQFRAGEPYLYRRLTPPWIINFPTKEHWRSVAALGYRLRSRIPRGALQGMGSHFSGGAGTRVRPGPAGLASRRANLYRHLSTLGIPVELFAPSEATDEEVTAAFLEGAETNGDDNLAPVPR